MKQYVSGRRPSPIGDAPRVLVPGHDLALQAGEHRTLTIAPQRRIGPPYWLGISCPENLRVQRLQIGHWMLPYCWGAASAKFFAVDPKMLWPHGLVPIDGPVCELGVQFLIEIYNVGCSSVLTNVTLWATALERVEDIDRSGGYQGWLDDLVASEKAEERALDESGSEWEQWQTPSDES